MKASIDTNNTDNNTIIISSSNKHSSVVLPPIVTTASSGGDRLSSDTATNNRFKPSIDDIEELHKSGSEIYNDDIDGNFDYGDDDENDDYGYDNVEKKLTIRNNDDIDEQNDKELDLRDPYWRKMLRQEERLNERYQLKKLHERANFLPNPRLFAARTAPL